MQTNTELSLDQSNKLLKAANFAAIKHINQRRKNKEASPYINHPLGVAWLLSNVGHVSDVEVLQAAILHDTVEDTSTTYDELVQEFGKKVADIVMECTDDKSLSKDERKKHQVAHSPHISSEAKLVKLGDKLYNLTDLLKSPPLGWDIERVQGYFVWAHAVVSGLRNTNAALEEQLDQVFSSQVEFQDSKFPALVPEAQRESFLQNYYVGMAAAKDQ